MTTKPKQVKQDWKKLEPGDEVIVIGTHDHETPGIVDGSLDSAGTGG